VSLVGAMTSVQVFLADGGNSPADVDPTTGHGPEWGKAAPIGLLIVVLMCVAVYFLVKSMNRNLKKVPESFDPAAKVSVGAADAGVPTVSDPAPTQAGPIAAAGADSTGVADPAPGGRAAE
jgi:hypothetical protein